MVLPLLKSMDLASPLLESTVLALSLLEGRELALLPLESTRCLQMRALRIAKACHLHCGVLLLVMAVVARQIVRPLLAG